MPQRKKMTRPHYSIKGKPAEAKEKIKAAADQVVTMIEELKQKYDQVDPATKKKIMVGLAGAAAGITALIGWKKRQSKKK